MTSPRSTDRFWNSDLNSIEESFLNGRKITDLEIHIDHPDNFINSDMEITNFLSRSDHQSKSMLGKIASWVRNIWARKFNVT